MNRRITRESTMLREARLRLGLSQQQVATLIGIQIRHYQRFEYGKREIQEINIRAGLSLCAVLELDPVDLVFSGNTVLLYPQRIILNALRMKTLTRSGATLLLSRRHPSL